MNKEREAGDEANAIMPGMDVEATRGDLGEEDISKPKVVRVDHDRVGNVKDVVVEKGAVFRQEIDVPPERIKRVESATPGHAHGRLVIDTDEAELEALQPGPQWLVKQHTDGTQQIDQDDLLGQVEQALPTAEGVRAMEASANVTHEGDGSSQVEHADEKKAKRGVFANPLLRLLGPGFLGGMAGNDSSAVTAYSIDGAQNGFGHLWLMLLSTPLYYAVMYTCAKIGRTTQQGLADVLREHYGRWVAVAAALLLIVSNVALIAADLVAIGSGLELITNLSWIWFVVPIGLILWYLTIFSNFEAIKRVFIVMSLAFLSYFVTVVLARPDWGSVLYNTFVPHIDFGFASISSAVALLGATVSPYNIFWQVQGEKEESRTGSRKQQMRFASLDVGVGVFSGNLIAYFIIICTAATLFTHHKNITTAADAALALAPILGPFAKYLFAIGFIGAGLVAIPVLLAGTSYAVAGTFGWPYGLSKKPWQNEGFYLILSLALVISVVLALLHFDPIRLMFWANVLSGVLSPVLVVYLIFLANNRKIMRGQRINWLTNIGLVVTFIVMAGAAVLLFYGLATGQGS